MDEVLDQFLAYRLLNCTKFETFVWIIFAKRVHNFCSLIDNNYDFDLSFSYLHYIDFNAIYEQYKTFVVYFVSPFTFNVKASF